MPRPIRPSRRGRTPGGEAPYYAEGELVTERVVVEESTPGVRTYPDEGQPLLWLVLLAVLAVLAVGAYVLWADDDTVINSPAPASSPAATQPPAAPPVIINQPPAAPPVIINQPPAQPSQQQAPSSAAPAPTAS